MTDASYKIVRLANGEHSVHSSAERETFHPVIGPVAEAEALYVNQLKLRERLASEPGEFVIWDVGLGAAANVLTVLKCTRDLPCQLRIVSFDKTLEPLRFALGHPKELGFIAGYESQIAEVLESGRAQFQFGLQKVKWELHLGDFPQLLRDEKRRAAWPAPRAILFDAFSPAKNPTMWTAELFVDLFRCLDQNQPCVLPTYSRSTMLRVTLLLAGFYVGVGHATGEKEETTIAANQLSLLAEPLPPAWLERVRRSRSAEPLREPIYRQAPLAAESWETLQRHPQFAA